jgi:hypothetical protein
LRRQPTRRHPRGADDETGRHQKETP